MDNFSLNIAFSKQFMVWRRMFEEGGDADTAYLNCSFYILVPVGESIVPSILL